MVGSAQTFLEYNTVNVYKHLLAMEDHLRNLSPRYESEDASCLVKHSLQLEEQADEGISHASELEDVEKVSVFRDVREGAKRLRVQFKSKISPTKMILEVRALRKRAEILDPSFNLEKCKSCGRSEEMLSELKDIDHSSESLGDLEWKMAINVLLDLSKKYNVQPPKLEIDNKCSEPSEGHYGDGKIRMCRGGINEHVLIHEFGHYLDDLKGKPLDEGDAEAFAVAEVDKGLYARNANHHSSEQKMVSPKVKNVAIALGGVNAGWGIGYAAKAFIDPMAPGAIMGQDPSLLIDAGGTVIGIIGAIKLKSERMRLLSGLIAAGLSVHLWEDLQKLLATPAAAMGVPAGVEVAGYPTVGVGAVGTMVPGIPSYPSAARRLAEYPFASPVSVGQTMSPPHYTINGVPGLKTVILGPKYTLDTF